MHAEEELVKLFCSNYWQSPKITAAVHCFHYNSHRHYYYHHFHYHWNYHYRLKILLTILFIVISSPICFNLSSFYRHMFFSNLIPIFSFFTPRHILGILFIPFIYIYSYLHFLTMREKRPNTELFLVRIFPYLDWIRRFTLYSVQIRGNMDQKKLRIWTLFTQCYLHSPVYTYSHLLIHTYALFTLLYEFDKIDKIRK